MCQYVEFVGLGSSARFFLRRHLISMMDESRRVELCRVGGSHGFSIRNCCVAVDGGLSRMEKFF